MTKVEKNIFDIIGDFVFQESITKETPLIDKKCLNSFEFVELILIIQEEYDIEIEDQDAESFKTIGDVINYVNNKLY